MALTEYTAKKKLHYGTETFDLSFNDKAYLIVSSKYGGYGCAYLLLGNYNQVCTITKLGGQNMSVSAEHKENFIDTITVTMPNNFSWYVIEL